jgi:hypothetical protein
MPRNEILTFLVFGRGEFYILSTFWLMDLLRYCKTSDSPELLLVGKDVFAVEAAGFHMVGFEPMENPVLQEARNRDLGVVDLGEIEIIGDIDTRRHKIIEEVNALST